MKISRISIFGRSQHSKGLAFEDLMGLVLDSLGYTNIIRRSIRPGLEIDLEADHKALNNHLLCECKAYKNPITTRSLRDFFGNYNYEQPEANRQLKAAFFSISGYTGQAHSWYKGMAPDKKNNFEIYDLEKIESLLVQGKLLLPEEEVDSIIMRNTDLPLGERYLLFFRSHLYLVQLIDVAGIHERFIILTATGEIPNRSVIDGIRKSDSILKSLRPIDFVIMDKVLVNLLDTKPRSIRELSMKIIETENDVEFALKELGEMDLLDEERLISDNLFSANLHVSAFSKIAKRLLGGGYRYDFMSSEYVQVATNDDYIGYIEKRFKINLGSSERVELLKLPRYFPSVIEFLLLGNTLTFENRYQQGPQNDQLNKILFDMLKDTITRKVLYDIEIAPARYLQNKGIDGYQNRNELMIVSEVETLFKLKSEGTNLVMTAVGTIRPGQAVVYADIEFFIRSGNILLVLGNVEGAIQTYDIVITSTLDPRLLNKAWHNKGVAYQRMNNQDKMTYCGTRAYQYRSLMEYTAITNFVLATKDLYFCRSLDFYSHIFRKYCPFLSY